MSNTETNEFMHRTTLRELNDEIKGLICSVRDLEHRIAEENLSGDQGKIAFAEMYPPATLFSNAIKSFPSIYAAFRTCLNKQGAALTPHSSHRTIMTRASSIYTDPEDTNPALDIVSGIIPRSRNRSSSNSTSDTQGVESTAGRSQQATSGATDSSKVAHNVAMRFRADKFTGDIGESWNEYLAEYMQVARDYNLSSQQKLQFLHNIMEGDAKRFYLDVFLPNVSTVNHAVELIGHEYNCIVRQNRVKNVLKTLRLQDKILESQEEGEALARVYKTITKLATQVPASHRGNGHKIEFLRIL